MSFSTDLQAASSHKALLGLQDFEINLYEGIKRFLSRRIKLDLDYARNLSTLTDHAKRSVPSDFTTPLSMVWNNILIYLNNLTEMISVNCLKINETCLPKLEVLINEKKVSLKSFMDQRNRHSIELQRLDDEVKRNFIAYEKLLQKFNNTKEKINQLKRGQSTSKSEDLWCKMMSTTSKLHSVHNLYHLSMTEFNSQQKHHNSVLLPGLLDGQQNLMEASVKRCQEVLLEYFDLSDYSKKHFQDLQVNITNLLTSLKPNLEYNEFVVENRSDPLTFTKKEFDSSLVDSSVGFTSETGLLIDEFAFEELQKIEMNMMSKLMAIKHDLATKRKELLNVKTETLGGDACWGIGTGSKNLKREIYELQCYEESYNSLVSSVSEALKTTNVSQLARAGESFDNLETKESPNYMSHDNKHLSKSLSSQFLTFFNQNKLSRKSRNKLKHIKMKSEANTVGYEETSTFRFYSNRARSFSLKDQAVGNHRAPRPSETDDLPDRTSKIGRGKRSSSETRINKSNSGDRNNGDIPTIAHRRDGARRRASDRDSPTNSNEAAEGGADRAMKKRTHDGRWSFDDSSLSSSDSFRMKVASKPPPPLPPIPKSRNPEGQRSEEELLESEEWFHGLLPRLEVLQLLLNDGDFLVRTTRNKATHPTGSPHRQQQFVLSVAFGNSHKHFIIQESQDGFHFEDDSFPTVIDLISSYMKQGIHVTERSQTIIKTPVARQPWELRNDCVRLLEKIGSGQFGEVYKGVFTIKPQKPSSKNPQLMQTSKPIVPPKPSVTTSPSMLAPLLKSSASEMVVAVKICKDSLDDENRGRFLMEANLLRSYSHPNIVEFIGVAILSAPVMIVMEFVEGGSLLNFLRKNPELSPLQLLSMSLDVAAGMSYLERKNCIHRDLAARNCLIKLNNSDVGSEADEPESFSIKISDFGMSKVENEYTISSGSRQIPIKWTAPEALAYGKYTTASDVWSFGVVVWELFTYGKVPYQGMSNAVASELVEKGHRLPEISTMPPKLYDLLLKCWYKDPEKRPHFHQILQNLQEIKTNMQLVP